MVVVFYLQDWSKGINDPPEAENYPPLGEAEVEVEEDGAGHQPTLKLRLAKQGEWRKAQGRKRSVDGEDRMTQISHSVLWNFVATAASPCLTSHVSRFKSHISHLTSHFFPHSTGNKMQ
jgi:hypothetical protein